MTLDTAIISVSDFLDAADRAAFQDETGYSVQLVSRAKQKNEFPAHWLWKVRDYCHAHGLEVPEHLFRGHPSRAIGGEN